MTVKISQNALDSVAASLASRGKGRSEEEARYDAIVAKCVRKPEGHSAPVLENPEDMVFTVTTVASSQRYGGTRIPAICTTFERAREIIERNEGDIYECSYRLAVIELIGTNYLYGGDSNQKFWYLYNDKEERYEAIETPPELEHFQGHNIG